MLPSRLAIASVLITLFCIGGTAQANPVPADAMSLENGAQAFQRYCTECHGWDPSEQYTSLYTEDESDPLLDFEPVEPEIPDEPVMDDWPEWAGAPPEPESSRESEMRSELLEEFNSAIDDAYADPDNTSRWESTQDYDAYGSGYDEDDGSSDLRRPGATDLTRPFDYLYGTTEVELFNHIAYGTGPTMPGFLRQLGSEQAVWDLVNYIRSLWGEDWVD